MTSNKKIVISSDQYAELIYYALKKEFGSPAGSEKRKAWKSIRDKISNKYTTTKKEVAL